MVNFRKSFLLAAMALAIGVGTASAQNCAATTGNPPILRAGGLEELTGSFALQCTNIATPTTVNFDVTLGTSSTSSNGTVIVTSRTGEPMVTVQQGGTFGSATGIVTSTLSNGTPAYNDVRFTGVNVPAGNSTITISGIRVNAVAVFNSVSGSLPTIYAFTSVSNGILQVTEPTQGLAVATIEPGLGTVSITPSSTGLSACAETLNLAVGTNFTINIPEQFPTAFKQQNAGPGVDSETGPLAAGAPPSVFNATQATTGTQLTVTFNGLPTGTTFYVPVTIFSYTGPASTTTPSTAAGGVAYIVTAAGTTTLNPGVAITTIANLPGNVVAVTTGSVITYNVYTSQPSVTETYQVPLFSTGGLISGSFGTVAVNLAPQAASSTVGEPVASDALVPLFYSTPQSQPLVPGSVGCQTSLLFTFLSNQAGFDTGISIAATGTDPFSTGVGGGQCTLDMYGLNAPATAPVLTVPSGQEAHTTVSAVAPNFQGYAIAVCTFTFAHGYAFISDGFMGAGRGLSEGYVANVINDRNGASSSVEAGVTTPETLGH